MRTDSQAPVLQFRWQESGGPAVSKPTRHGFGSELLRQQLQYELSAESGMEFAKEGLMATINIPMSAIARDSRAEESAATGG